MDNIWRYCLVLWFMVKI